MRGTHKLPLVRVLRPITVETASPLLDCDAPHLARSTARVSFCTDSAASRQRTVHKKIMAPSVSPGSAATALSLLVLAASNVGMWLRIADMAPRGESAEPEPELTSGAPELEGKIGQLEGSIASLGVRTARCEALLEPLEATKPDQSTPENFELCRPSATCKLCGTDVIDGQPLGQGQRLRVQGHLRRAVQPMGLGGG